MVHHRPQPWRTNKGPAWRAALLLLFAAASAPLAVAQPEFDQIAPILDERCVVCHSGPGAPLDLRLDSFDAVMAGSANGPVVVPGDPEASELVRRIRGTSQPRMPLTGPPFLSDGEIALIADWIAAGAPAEVDGAAAGPGGEVPGEDVPADDVPAVEPAAGEPPAGGGGVDPITFAQVEAILLQRCASCHSDASILGRPPEGLRLDSYRSVIAGADRIVVVPGAPAASELMRRITGQALPRMPFDGPPFLDEEQQATIRAWIAAGAPDAAGIAAPVPVGAEVRLHGVLRDGWHLDDLPLRVSDATRVEDDVAPGSYVEVRGVVLEGGSIRAERIRPR